MLAIVTDKITSQATSTSKLNNYQTRKVIMRIEKANQAIAKGWYTGPWDSDLDISLGFANEGVDEPHYHQQMTEIYFMARGTAEMRVGNQTIVLMAKDVLIVEPGEVHTFLSSSPDHFHFVIQTPGLIGDVAKVDKVIVPRSQFIEDTNKS